MPEYLTPGVYVEEVSFRSKSIEGVATATTGFVGSTRFGPVRYLGGPTTNHPRLVTNFREFEEVFGGMENFDFQAGGSPRNHPVNYLAHAARAFFLNGGQRLYVARAFLPAGGDGVARRVVAFNGDNAIWAARWPGAYGNVRVEVLPVRSRNIAYNHANPALGRQVRGVRPGAVVEIFPAGTPIPAEPRRDPDTGLWQVTPPVPGNLREIILDPLTGRQRFMTDVLNDVEAAPAGDDQIVLVELQARVRVNRERENVYDKLAVHPDQTRYIGKILARDHPEDENSVVWLNWTHRRNNGSAELLAALIGNPNPVLEGGNDGASPTPNDLLGNESDPDDPTQTARGIWALEEIEDVAIVAAPDASTYADSDECFTAQNHLVASAERSHFRIAVVDAPENQSVSGVRGFRGRFDSTYAALYHPWIEVFDPTQSRAQGAPPARIALPPSGFVTGIYARTDVRRGVFKAPANEVVMGLTDFESNINDRRQAVLNPEGINALRFFDGRGYRVWGARTMTSDPEWKYVNVRRLFIYLEHSIYRSTQWAVFEPNNERLWGNVRETVSDFLYTLWRDGALVGNKPDQAYFVRCDRTTMSQNDLDNGRLICLIGVAPARPAEFVIFRVGQWTGDAAS